MSEFLSKLNPQQREAVVTIEGPLLVLAGAGTGKTRVITCRIAHMIGQGIDPASILGMTFTNKAAREMRERLDQMVDPAKARKVCLGTFHAFCARMLRKDIAYAGQYNSNFSIADESDQKGLLRQAAAELGYSKEDAPVDQAASFIGDCKNKMLWPPDAVEYAEREYPAKAPLARIYGKYQRLLELQNTVDFDDLLLLALKILDKSPEVLKRYQETYKYLMVDEYQDTNAAQFELLKRLCGTRNNICVVGDDDQSIYGWRGAEVENILDFPKLFPGAKEIKLEQNYRSTNKILETANSVISRNGRR
jgi:superfamily I DNA/RNA helicase